MKLTRTLPGVTLCLGIALVAGCPNNSPQPTASNAPATGATAAPTGTTTTTTATPTPAPNATPTPFVNGVTPAFTGFPATTAFTGRLTYDGGNLPFDAGAVYRDASLTDVNKYGPNGLELARTARTGHFYFTTKSASPSLQVRYLGTGELEEADVNFLNEFTGDVIPWASHSTDVMTPDITYDIKWDSNLLVPAPHLLIGNMYSSTTGFKIPRFKGLDGEYEIRVSKGRPGNTNRVFTATVSAGVETISLPWDGKGCTRKATGTASATNYSCVPESSASAVVTGDVAQSKLWMQVFVTKPGGKQGEKNFALSKYLIFQTPGAAAAPTDAATLVGKTLYNQKCWICHVNEKSYKTRAQIDTAITDVPAMLNLSTLTSAERDSIVKYSAWLYNPVNP